MTKKPATCLLIPDPLGSDADFDVLKKALGVAYTVQLLPLAHQLPEDGRELTAVRGVWIDDAQLACQAIRDKKQDCYIIGLGAGALVAINLSMHIHPQKLVLINAPVLGTGAIGEFFALSRARKKDPARAFLMHECRELRLDSKDFISEVSSPTLVLQAKDSKQNEEDGDFLMRRLGSGQWMVEKELIRLPECGGKPFSDKAGEISIPTILSFLEKEF